MAVCTVWNDLHIGVGDLADYHGLSEFHYRSGRPRAVMRVLAARYEPAGGAGCVAGVLLESLPALCCSLRHAALPGRYVGGDRALLAARLNSEVRTISRVIVHPVFRSLGLARALVREALATAQTPYVEALAAMGRVQPFFAQAGMQAYDRPADAGAQRLMAALEYEGLRPIDLVDAERIVVTPLLVRELRRFTRLQTGDAPMLICAARKRLLSQPVYYLWRRGDEAMVNTTALDDEDKLATNEHE